MKLKKMVSCVVPTILCFVMCLQVAYADTDYSGHSDEELCDMMQDNSESWWDDPDNRSDYEQANSDIRDELESRGNSVSYDNGCTSVSNSSGSCVYDNSGSTYGWDDDDDDDDYNYGIWNAYRAANDYTAASNAWHSASNRAEQVALERQNQAIRDMAEKMGFSTSYDSGSGASVIASRNGDFRIECSTSSTYTTSTGDTATVTCEGTPMIVSSASPDTGDTFDRV